MSDDERDNDIESDADKRAHHNALERKRRDHIKDSFSSLRAVLSLYGGDNKVRSSRAQTLKKATEHIHHMVEANAAVQQEIVNLKIQNKSLEDEVRQLEEALENEDLDAAKAVVKLIRSGNKWPNTVTFDDDSDSKESSVNSDSNPYLAESDEDIMEVDEPPRKRLKMN